MKTRYTRTLLAIPLVVLPLAASLVGCDDDDAPATTALTITPSLGLVRNATVVVKTPAGAVVGSGTTGTDGTLTLTASGSAPFVVEVQGDADAEYFDEHTGQFEPFLAPRKIRAMVPFGPTSIGVTGLTDVAASLLEGSGAPITNGNINLANNAVLQTFASAAPAGLTDLLTPPRVLSGAPTAGYLAANAADMYAAILAGLAETGGSDPTPALTAIEQLRRDVSDGSLDGQENGSAITGLVYTPGTFATDFAGKVSNYVGSYGNTALQTAVTSYTITALVEPTWATGGGGGGTGNCTHPTAATWFASRGGTYVMEVTGSANGLTSQFDGRTEYDVIVDTAGTITVAGDTTQFSFARTEITMIDECALTAGGNPYEGYAIYVDATSGYTAIFQHQYDLDGFSFSIYEPYTQGANPNLLDNVYLRVPQAVPVTVSNFSPTSGAVGATVTITGTGFDADPFHMQVFFSNNIAATVVSSTATQVVVQVPAGAVTGPLRVTNTLTGATSTDTANFTVTGGGGGGGSWTSRASPSGYVLNGLGYGGGTFVAVGMGNTIMTSTDGLSWTNRLAAATGLDNQWFSGNAVIHDGTRFIMVGDKTGSNPALIATSTDGASWTRRTWSSATTEYQLTDVAAANGRITVVGANGVIATSTDGGANWQEETQSVASAFHGVTANGTTRVAVGRDSGYYGVIMYNSGSGWTMATGITDFYPQDVVWTGEQFVAVGGVSSSGNSNPVVMTSPNGTSWTRYPLSATEASTGKPLQEVTWDATASKLYATGYDATSSHIIISSSNGSSWTLEHQATVTGNGALGGIASSGTRIVTVGGTRSVTKP